MWDLCVLRTPLHAAWGAAAPFRHARSRCEAAGAMGAWHGAGPVPRGTYTRATESCVGQAGAGWGRGLQACPGPFPAAGCNSHDRQQYAHVHMLQRISAVDDFSHHGRSRGAWTLLHRYSNSDTPQSTFKSKLLPLAGPSYLAWEHARGVACSWCGMLVAEAWRTSHTLPLCHPSCPHPRS